MKKSKPTTLLVSASELLKASDKLTTTKRWFNGAKFFHTVKLLPPKK